MRPALTTLCAALPVALACGGAVPTGSTPSPTPAAATASPAPGAVPAVPDTPSEPPDILHAQVDGKACTVALVDGASRDPVTQFDAPCGRWTASRNPTKARDIVTTMEGQAPRRGRASLPDLPDAALADLDELGFDASGTLFAAVSASVDPVMDAAARTAKVTLGSTTHDLDYDSAEMFGVIACEIWKLERRQWERVAGPVPVQLHEGMRPPWCTGIDGAPDFEAARPGSRQLASDAWTDVPAALQGKLGDNEGWYKASEHDVAFGGMWFEGVLSQLPLAVKRADWEIVDGLGNPGEPVDVDVVGTRLAVCSTKGGVVLQLPGFEEIWRGPPPCPILVER